MEKIEKNYVSQMIKITNTLDSLKSINIKEKYKRILMDSLTTD